MNATFHPKIELCWHTLGSLAICPPIYFVDTINEQFSEFLLGATYHTMCFSGGHILARDKVMRGFNLNPMNSNSCKFFLIHRIAARDNLFQLSYFSRRELRSIGVKRLVQGPTAGDWRGWDDRLFFSLLLSQCWFYYTCLRNNPHIWKRELGNSLSNTSLSNESLADWNLHLFFFFF